MDNKYKKLFDEIIHTVEILSEQVMEYSHNLNDEHGENTARVMRDDYANLYDRVTKTDFNTDTLTKADFAKILVGALIVTNNIEERITAEKKAVEGYKNDVIPKLQRIIDKAKTEDDVLKMAKELFKIEKSSN